MLPSILTTMSALWFFWDFGAHELSLLPCCLRLACSVAAADSRLASNAVVSSLFDGASTHRTIYPLLDARADPNVANVLLHCFQIRPLHS